MLVLGIDSSAVAASAAVAEDGLSISRGSVPDAENDVVQWVAGLNL